ncbi:TSUP family transporter [bacterium]|nr:TSUP family transporter [bacterium]
MPEYDVLLYGLPLAFLAGFVDAIAGGGGVITLPTLLMMGLSPGQAVATNKLLAVFGSTSSALAFWRKGAVDKALLIRIAPLALLGSGLGAFLVSQLRDTGGFRNAIAVLILAVGALVIANRSLGLENRFPGLTPRTLAIGMGAAFTIGVYDGFIGPGTGTFLMFCFVSFLGFDFVTGSGNARVINFVTNVAALVLFLFAGQMIFWLGLSMGVANALGAQLGAHMAMLRGSKFVKVIYLGIVLAVAGRLLFVR